jgi:hypothetical protein
MENNIEDIYIEVIQNILVEVSKQITEINNLIREIKWTLEN